MYYVYDDDDDDNNSRSNALAVNEAYIRPT